MTVKELISLLEEMPSDSDVVIPSRTGGWNVVTDVLEDDEVFSTVKIS